ncbi:hypothetical protein ACIOVF_27080 [Pseudomonas sp. NPDC087612]|uniref:hypothetical protein n=1 Tax=Pseudomonas sp. NPDC087612 TaxID=3364441 RepID=UPI003820A261
MIPSYYTIIKARAKIIRSGAKVTLSNVQKELSAAFYKPAIASRLREIEANIQRPVLLSQNAPNYGSRQALAELRISFSEMSHYQLATELERLMLYIIPELYLKLSLLEDAAKNKCSANNSAEKEYSIDGEVGTSDFSSGSRSIRDLSKLSVELGINSKGGRRYSCTNCGLMLEIPYEPDQAGLSSDPAELQTKIGLLASELYRSEHNEGQLKKKVVKLNRQIVELHHRVKMLDDVVYSIRAQLS